MSRKDGKSIFYKRMLDDELITQDEFYFLLCYGKAKIELEREAC